MAKLDSNIYGFDETDFAESCASDALNPKGKEDIWGAAIDQKAVAKGNDPEHENQDAKSVTAVGTQTATKSKGN